MGLDIGIPPRRLGRALRRARRDLGLRRPEAATRLGVSAALLSAWERGAERVPQEYGVALLDLYGDHLRARVPERDPARLELDRLVVGSEVRILASPAADEVLTAYVEVLRGLRNTPPGAPMPLRTSDLTALAAALGTDDADIEVRIARLLHCSLDEAKLVHNEMRRRRILVPIAGAAVGLAITGAALHAAVANTGGAAPGVVVGHAPVTILSTSTTSAPTTTTSSSTTTTTATTAAAVTTTTPAPAPHTPTTDAPAPTTSTTDDPPVSILPGETPTIITP